MSTKISVDSDGNASIKGKCGTLWSGKCSIEKQGEGQEIELNCNLDKVFDCKEGEKMKENPKGFKKGDQVWWGKKAFGFVERGGSFNASKDQEKYSGNNMNTLFPFDIKKGERIIELFNPNGRDLTISIVPVSKLRKTRPNLHIMKNPSIRCDVVDNSKKSPNEVKSNPIAPLCPVSVELIRKNDGKVVIESDQALVDMLLKS